MRLSVLSIALLVATSPAYGQRRERDRNETDAVARACSVEDCFREADVREFEIIDRTHVIVYVGSQRCAFHLEVRGALCDLSFAPEFYFRQANEVPQIVLGRAHGLTSADAPRVGTRPGDFDSFQIEQRERDDLRDLRQRPDDPGSWGHWTEIRSRRAWAQTDSATQLRTARFRASRRSPTISFLSSMSDAVCSRRCRRWAPEKSKSASKKSRGPLLRQIATGSNARLVSLR